MAYYTFLTFILLFIFQPTTYYSNIQHITNKQKVCLNPRLSAVCIVPQSRCLEVMQLTNQRPLQFPDNQWGNFAIVQSCVCHIWRLLGQRRGKVYLTGKLQYNIKDIQNNDKDANQTSFFKETFKESNRIYLILAVKI